MGRELVKEYENEDFSEIIAEITKLCGLSTQLIQTKTVYDCSYSQGTSYDITNDLCEWLTDKIECEDCKNGCQLYKDESGYYFCITGSNYYDKETDEYRGTDEVHIYFRNHEEW